jgi:hypothetical protein
MSLDKAEEYTFCGGDLPVYHHKTGVLIGKLEHSFFIEHKRLSKASNGHPIIVCEFSKIKTSKVVMT